MTRTARSCILLCAVAWTAGCKCAQLPDAQWRCEDGAVSCGGDGGQAADSGSPDGGTPATDGGRDAGAGCVLPVLDPVCRNGWCWAYPLPHGNPINGIWASSAQDLWAVGSNGTITHSDGTSWVGVVSPTDKDLYSVWGSSADDVWAVGQDDTWLHWNCNGWSPPDGGYDAGSSGDTLFSVWGTSPTDAWAVGDTGAFHWDGAQWVLNGSLTTTGTQLRGVWGNATNNYWAVGTNGATFYWDGGTWAPGPGLPSSPVNLYGVWGSGNNVWAAGYQNVFLLSDGGWTSVFTCTSETFRAVWGTSTNDLWIAGNLGALWHSNDGTAPENCASLTTSWVQRTPLEFQNIDLASGVSLLPSYDARVAGAGGSVATLFFESGTLVQAGGHNALFDTVWSDGTNVFVGGTREGPEGAIYVLDAGHLVDITPSSSPSIGAVTAIRGISANDLWAADTLGQAWFYDGGSWSLQAGLLNFVGLGIVPMNGDVNVWVVGVDGGEGNVLWRNDAGWYPDPDTAVGTLSAAFGLSKGASVWAVGSGGHIALADNATGTWLKLQVLPCTENLHALWCDAPDTATGTCFAVGDNAARCVGPSNAGFNSASTVPGEPPLRGIWGSASLEIWAVGDKGLAFYGDGGVSWLPESVGTVNNLSAVWISPGGAQGWIVGENATILRKQ